MPPYKKMYFFLFNAITDALEALRIQDYEQAKEILINAQQRGEDLYIEAGEKSLKTALALTLFEILPRSTKRRLHRTVKSAFVSFVRFSVRPPALFRTPFSQACGRCHPSARCRAHRPGDKY